MATFPNSEDAILHVVGQDFEHSPVTIAGNTEGLRQLRNALDAALQSEGRYYHPGADIYTNDGEGYQLAVLRVADDQAGYGALPCTYLSYILCKHCRHNPAGR